MPELRIAKESGHVDQCILVKNPHLVRAQLEEAGVFRQRIDAPYHHAASDPTADGLLLVWPQVESGNIAQHLQNALQALLLVRYGQTIFKRTNLSHFQEVAVFCPERLDTTAPESSLPPLRFAESAPDATGV
jgi:hypothetical protein